MAHRDSVASFSNSTDPFGNAGTTGFAGNWMFNARCTQCAELSAAAPSNGTKFRRCPADVSNNFVCSQCGDGSPTNAFSAVLEWIVAALPFGKAAEQRANSCDPEPPEFQRQTGARGFVRSSAVENDLAISR